MDQAELCEHCQFVTDISVPLQRATTVERVTRKQAREKRWFAYVQKRTGDSFSREASVSHTVVETITELDQGYLLSRKYTFHSAAKKWLVHGVMCVTHVYIMTR